MTALTAPCQRLADPDQRPAGAARPERSDLPPLADAGQRSSRDKQQAAEKITAGLMNLMQQGMIRSRQGGDAAGKLRPDRGTETKSSISIADPDGGRNIRLKGMIYERDFKFMKGFEEKSKQQAQDTELSVKREFARLETSISAELQSSSQSISNAIREQNGRLTGMIRTSVSAAMAWIFSFCPDRYPGRDNLVSGHDHHLAPERDGQLQPTAGEPESEKRRGRDDLQRRQEPNTYLVVLPKQAHGVETYTSTTDNTVVK
ncbi:MbeB family mobilization protein, partial [Serratia ureilytica]